MKMHCRSVLNAWIVEVGILAVVLMTNANGQTMLKDIYKNDFLVGVALKKAHIDGKDTRTISIVKNQFNSISPENVLKWEFVHPKPDCFDFASADRYVKFGETNGMFTVGHVLVWQNQTPMWVFQDEKGNPIDRETLLRRMRDHIFKVVGRYKGRIGGWDVVNETIGEDGTYQNTPWMRIIGEDYVEKAFEYAWEADPKAELYYNDFTLYKPAKRDGVIELIKRLQTKGVRIDGVGFQGHYQLDNPTIEDVEASMDAFSKLGLKVMFTELDVDVLPAAWDFMGADITQNFKFQKELNPYAAGLPDSVQQKLAKRYADLFGLFIKHRDTITRVTLWGVTDADSWLNDWPVRGRTNYPLLFDREGSPKQAFEAVVETAHQMENER